jgi:hypothetical protein
MDDTSTIEASAPPKRRKGSGAGKPAPGVVLNGSNIGAFFEGEQPRRRRGRPSSYTLQRGKRICTELILGRSLYSILQDEGSPDRGTLARWLAAHPDFYAEYARAREIGWDSLAEQQLERTRDIDPEHANSRKVEVDYVKWYLSKVAHRRYGDKLQVDQNISGSISIDVLISQQLLTPANLEKLTEDEIDIWQRALSTIPKLLAPASTGQLIEGTYHALPAPITEAQDAGT